jgi:UDP-N-acetylglucosamine:LPS N-acetylglucosamine transferase
MPSGQLGEPLARKFGWGEVVDEPDPAKLAEAIDRLMHDEARQKALVAAAYEEAQRRLRQKWLANCEKSWNASRVSLNKCF